MGEDVLGWCSLFTFTKSYARNGSFWRIEILKHIFKSVCDSNNNWLLYTLSPTTTQNTTTATITNKHSIIMKSIYRFAFKSSCAFGIDTCHFNWMFIGYCCRMSRCCSKSVQRSIVIQIAKTYKHIFEFFNKPAKLLHRFIFLMTT